MIPYSGVDGNATIPTRRYRIGATVVADQIVVAMDTAARTGVITDPTSVTVYDRAVGVTLEAGTYTTTQGTGTSSADVHVTTSWSPFQLYRGRLTGGSAAAGTAALTEALNGNLLTNTAASAGGTVVSDTDVGTSEFVGGYLLALTGANRGAVRVINAHTDDVSTTVAVPFDYALAVNDTFLRTYAPFQRGLRLTLTNFLAFNSAPGAAVDLPDTGDALTWDIEFDIDDQGTSAAPLAFAIFTLEEHFMNSRV